MALIKTIVIFLVVCLPLFSNGQSVGGVTSGSATFCDTINSGFVSVTGYTGNIITWQYSENNGGTWTNNSNTFSSQSYFNLKKTTCYRAIVKNGSFPADTSSVVCVNISLPTVAGSISGGGVFCGSSGSGAITLSGNTGTVVSWQSSINNGTTWNNISNTSSILTYSNISQNTLFQVIVQNGSFCKKDTSNQVSFTIFPNTVSGSISSVGSKTLCYGSNTRTMTLSGNVGNILNWISSTNNGTNWTSINNTTNTLTIQNISQPTWYAAIVQNASCSIDTTNIIKFFIYPYYTVNAGKDTIILDGQTATLIGFGAGTPTWTPSNANIISPNSYTTVVSPTTSTDYILLVTDVNSCVGSDTVNVKVISATYDGKITNVFTPNGDGFNDTWFIEGSEYYPKCEVHVYNIYGQEVYYKVGYTNDWNGTYNNTPLPDGTYYYIFKTTETSAAIKGSVEILRNK